jgi:hypothetical protein
LLESNRNHNIDWVSGHQANEEEGEGHDSPDGEYGLNERPKGETTVDISGTMPKHIEQTGAVLTGCGLAYCRIACCHS